MSMFNPDHLYEVMIYDNQDRRAKEQFIAINCVAKRVKIAEKVQLPGRYLMVLEDKGHNVPITEKDESTGQERTVGYRWMPRFGISVISDLTTKNSINAAPIPHGGVDLSYKAPVQLSADEVFVRQSIEVENVEEPKEETEVVNYNMMDLVTLKGLCAKNGIRYNAKATKEELIESLEGKE